MSDILREANTAYDLAAMRIEAVVEAANRQREINFHEAELKVMQESGTDDELAALIEAADEDFVENIQKSIDKLRDAIVKFFSDCRQKLVDLMGKRDDQNKLDQLEKRMKLIPLLGKKKIMIEDYDAAYALAKKHLKSLSAITAKMRGKQEIDVSEISAIKKAFDDEHNDVIGASNAKSVTVSEAITKAKKMIASGSAELKERESTALKACDDAKKDAEKFNANAANQIATVTCHICKVSQNDYHRCVNGIMSSIKKAIGAYKAQDTEAVKKESTDDMNDAEMEKLANQQDDTNSKDSVDEDADFDDDIDLGFGVASDDALTAGFDGIDDDDDLDDAFDDDDDDDDEDDIDGDDDEECGTECGTECGYECRESADDEYLASLAGVKFESSHERSNDYSSLMSEIMDLGL